MDILKECIGSYPLKLMLNYLSNDDLVELYTTSNSAKIEIYYTALSRRYFNNCMLIENAFNYDKLPPPILKLIRYFANNQVFVISGGFTTSLMFDLPIRAESDIDIWCMRYGTAPELMSPVYNWLKANFTIVKIIKIAAGIINIQLKEITYSLQFIFIDERTVADVIGQYDFSHNKSAIYMGKTYTTYDAIDSYVGNKINNVINQTDDRVENQIKNEVEKQIENEIKNVIKKYNLIRTTLYKETSIVRIDKIISLGYTISNLSEFYDSDELQLLRLTQKTKNTGEGIELDNDSHRIMSMNFVSFRTNSYIHKILPKLRITLTNYKDFDYNLDHKNNLSIIWGNGKIKRCEIRTIICGSKNNERYGDSLIIKDTLTDLKLIIDYVCKKLFILFRMKHI